MELRSARLPKLLLRLPGVLLKRSANRRECVLADLFRIRLSTSTELLLQPQRTQTASLAEQFRWVKSIDCPESCIHFHNRGFSVRHTGLRDVLVLKRHPRDALARETVTQFSFRSSVTFVNQSHDLCRMFL